MEMHDQASGFAVKLEPSECWELLSRSGFGRIALPYGDDDIDIFPINFAVDGDDIVFRTAEGTKLVEVVLSDRVTLQADDRDMERGVAWSVVVKGCPVSLQTLDAIEAAERLCIRPWTNSSKNRFVRIIRTRISGRRFHAPATS